MYTCTLIYFGYLLYQICSYFISAHASIFALLHRYFFEAFRAASSLYHSVLISYETLMNKYDSGTCLCWFNTSSFFSPMFTDLHRD